jgi:hypothetical protein
VLLVEQERLTLPEHLSSPPGFSGVRVTRSLVSCVCFVDRCLSFFFWPLCCMLFFEIMILITSLVSSNSSQNYIMLDLFYYLDYMDYRNKIDIKTKTKQKIAKQCYGRSVIGCYIIYTFKMLLSLQSASNYERSVP